MNEQEMLVFVEAIAHYFDQTSDTRAVVGTPYLTEGDAPLPHPYTGIIGVSGRRKGCVYFTAPSALLKHLLLSLGESDTGHDNLCDLVGEVANTLAGNARRMFGQEFLISVPVVLEGRLERIRLPHHLRAFVIPIQWKTYEAALVISLE